MKWPPSKISNNYDLKWYPTIDGNYSKFWNKVYNYTKFKSLFEIGFNAGHTSHLLLDMYGVNITSVDKVDTDYTLECSRLLKEKYVDKFNFLHSESNKINYKLYKNKFDLIFIDGCHEFNCVVNDILLASKMEIKYIVFDDTQFNTVTNAIHSFKNKIAFNKIIEFNYLDCLKNNNKISLYEITNNYQFNLL